MKYKKNTQEPSGSGTRGRSGSSERRTREDRDPQKEELKDLLKEEEPVGLPKEEEPEELLPICQNTYTRSTCRKISRKL